MGCLVRCFLFYSFCFGLFFKNFLFLLFLTKWQFRWHEFWNEIFNQVVLLMLPICRRYCIDVTQIQQCHVWIWPWSHAKPDCNQRLCNRELFLGSTWINQIETSQVMFWNLSSLPFFFFFNHFICWIGHFIYPCLGSWIIPRGTGWCSAPQAPAHLILQCSCVWSLPLLLASPRSHSLSEQIHAEDGVAKSHLRSWMLSTGWICEAGILHLVAPATASQAFGLKL